MKKLLTALAGVLLLGYVQIAIGDPIANEQSTPNSLADAAVKIQSQLELRYPLAKTTADGGDLIAAGAVLVLQKDNLVLNKVYMNGTHRSSPVENVYESDKITQVGLMGALSSINSLLSVLGGTEAESKTFGHGERFWVTKMAAQADGIVFQLMTDPINNMRYHGSLKFPYAKIPALDQALTLVANVLTTDPPFAADGGNTAQASVPSTAQSIEDQGEETRRAAEAGDPDAMYRLGNMAAQQGANVEAARWFRLASERNHVKATNALGFMYEEGRGVPQNFAQANSLYVRAMRRGNADAMVNRGLMYANGVGAAKDSIQAYMHFLLAVAYAADQDTHDAATKLRDEIVAKLSKQQLARGQAMADKFARTEIK